MPSFPKEFIIQWHLTERCNWSCKHCYRNAREFKELSFKQLQDTFIQVLELFSALHIPMSRAYINIGGGEPLLRKDLFKFLEFLNKSRDYMTIRIMTNGSLITNSIAKDLKKVGVKAVQVSLEGLQETNDKIRGKGSFDKTIRAIGLLKKNSLITRASLTLTKANVAEIENLAIYLKSIGVGTFGIRRYVPLGSGEQLKETMLSPLEMQEFYLKKEKMKKRLDEAGKFMITHGCEDAIYCAGANSDFRYYSCGLTKGCHLNIFTNGDILTCRRLPIVVGNVLQNSLLDVYFSSEQLWNFRNLDNMHPLCKKCFYFKYCLGGARCISYAYFKSPFAPDPQCWRLFKKLPEVSRFSKTEKEEFESIGVSGTFLN